MNLRNWSSLQKKNSERQGYQGPALFWFSKLHEAAISHLFFDHRKGFDIEIIYSIGMRDFYP